MTGIICECCGNGVSKTGAICDPCVAAFHEQATEIERLRVEADKLLLTLEITTIERDKAREVAKMCYARIRPHNIPGMPKGAYDEWCSVLLQRHPWLEEK